MADTCRIEKMEDDLDNQNDIDCPGEYGECCEGIMEYDSYTDTWVCSDCQLELNEDDLMEVVIEEENEMRFD